VWNFCLAVVPVVAGVPAADDISNFAIFAVADAGVL
jgi:hypothetical protein